MTKIVAKPKDIKKEHLNQILDLVKAGGQVNIEGLRDRICNVDLIAYTLESEKVICTATLKNPNNSYKTDIFNLAQANTKLNYEKELGYIVTHPDFEGKKHCQNLLKEFFPKISNHSIFASTRKPSMVHILEKFGFKRTGKQYKKDLILLIYNGKE